MTATKPASLESKHYFNKHQETTRAELHKISTKEDLSDKQEKELTDLLLDKVKEKQNTEESKKHAEIRKADYKKIRELVIQRVGDAKKVTKEDIQEAIDFFYGKSEKKESKEKMKTPQLEAENYKIDKWKSKKEKLAEWWKEVERTAYIDGNETRIRVLKKELAPGAFVREYQDDGKMPAHLVGEQLFNCRAVLILGLHGRLPTWEDMVTMRWDNHQEFWKNNFQKDWKDLLSGSWDPDLEKFYGIGDRTSCWLSDGDHVRLGKDSMLSDGSNPEFGFSLRLLKN